MGGKNQTTTSNSTQTITPAALGNLQDIWNKVQGAASTPYQGYTGQMTAGLDPTQQAGINTINSAQGTAQPYYDQATQYANQAAQPITAAQIQNYQSPYTQQVVNATQSQFNNSNAQQQQQVVGNAALQGALGGDRVGVAQAELANQQKLAQDPTIAGLYNQGYTQALGAAQQDRAAQGQAAYSLGSLGSAAQNTAIQGGTSQLGAGAVAQGTTQAGLSAAYQQYLQQQAFPYQQAQFLASYGLPAATAQGGTQTGQSETTQPGPNPLGQLLGAGVSAAAAYSDRRVKKNVDEIGKTFDGQPIYRFEYKGDNKPQIGLMAQDVEKHHPGAVGSSNGIKTVDYNKATESAAQRGRFANGGSVGYASGGTPMSADNFMMIPSFIPQGNGGAPQAQTPQMAPMQTPKVTPAQGMQFPSAASMKGMTAGFGDLYNKFKLGDDGLGNWNDYSWDGGTPLFGGADIGGAGGGIGMAAFGGRINRAAGGAVSPSPFIQGYDVGGNVDPDFATRWADVDAANNDFNRPAADASPYPIVNADTLGLGKPVDWSPAQQNAPGMVASGATPQAIQSADLPPQITNPDGQSPYTSSAMSFSGGQPPVVASSPGTSVPDDGSAMDLSAQSKQPEGESSKSKFGNFNPLGLSDNARTALITAGLGMMASRSPFALNAIGEGGLQGVNTYNQLTKQTQDQANKKQEIDLRAKQLAQSAEQFSKTFGLQSQQFGETQKQRQIQAMQPVKLGTDSLGHDVYGVRDPSSGTMKIIDPQTGAFKEPGASTPDATTGTPGSGDAFLKTLPPQVQNTIKAIASGDSDLSKVGFKDRTAYMNLASQYDPSFNTYTAPLRAQTAKQFTGSGVEARNFQSNDMAIKHIGTGLENIEAMNNSKYPLYNAIANPLARNTGDTKFQQANTALGTDIDAIGSELMRAFRGSGSASEKEAAEWREKFPINGSPVEQRTAMKEAAKLLASRVTASGERYNDAMGPLHARDPLSWLSPEGREVFQGALNLDPQKSVPPRSQWAAPKGGTAPPNAAPASVAADPLSNARAAIARGAPRDAVIKRLSDAGIDPSGL